MVHQLLALTRTETVLRRAGYYDHPERFNTLTETDVMGWWNAGVATVADIRFAGNRAIRRHIEETDERSQLNLDLDALVAEPWARHIWWHDPRFKPHLPKGDSTLLEVVTNGTPTNVGGVSRRCWLPPIPNLIHTGRRTSPAPHPSSVGGVDAADQRR